VRERGRAVALDVEHFFPARGPGRQFDLRPAQAQGLRDESHKFPVGLAIDGWRLEGDPQALAVNAGHPRRARPRLRVDEEAQPRSIPPGPGNAGGRERIRAFARQL